MTDAPREFDGTSDDDLSAFDEMPLWSALHGRLLLDHVTMPRAGARVLDLGCGTGFPLIELAERLGPSRLAVGADTWRTALRRAAFKARTRGTANVRVVLADAVRLPFRGAASTSSCRTAASTTSTTRRRRSPSAAACCCPAAASR
jgi:SAM-dependent methyltransferase